MKSFPLTLFWVVTIDGAAVRRSAPTVDLGYAIHQGTINVMTTTISIYGGMII
jgi:hypothetical protein